MLGNIIEINDNIVTIDLDVDITKQPNLVGLHLIFEDGDKKIVGEIISANTEYLKANILGEFVGNVFTPGANTKPSFMSKIRIITINEIEQLLGKQEDTIDNVLFGISNVYRNYKINIDINPFFSNHFAILGNSGSGKSFTVAGLFQRLLSGKNAAVGSNIFMFDAYGEYTNAFSELHKSNQNINYKVYTTNSNDGSNVIKIPLWLLDVDDIALLLGANSTNQLPIIEKALKLIPIITERSITTIKYKNDIIARALQDVLLSGGESTKIRDQVIAILTKFKTEELNLESKIVIPGYARTLKQCLYIDNTGKMQEMELVVSFVNSFIDDSLKIEELKAPIYYTLIDLEEALEFALISEGILKSNRVYDMANVLLVRLHALANGKEAVYFSYPEYVTRNQYIMKLLTDSNNQKCQIVNFNISDVDDRLAKVITKIISRLLFKESTEMKERGSVPFHIVIEEAHRYVQKDSDVEILGYNIFERITKEGRKYGIILGLITQRPSELSDTVVSQCSNFLILKMTHPNDLNYIKTMIPNVTMEIVERLKNLKPGNCIAFGSAFKIPIGLYVIAPNPTPMSNNVDMVKSWHRNTTVESQTTAINQVIPEVDKDVINKPNLITNN